MRATTVANPPKREARVDFRGARRSLEQRRLQRELLLEAIDHLEEGGEALRLPRIRERTTEISIHGAGLRDQVVAKIVLELGLALRGLRQNHPDMAAVAVHGIPADHVLARYVSDGCPVKQGFVDLGSIRVSAYGARASHLIPLSTVRDALVVSRDIMSHRCPDSYGEPCAYASCGSGVDYGIRLASRLGRLPFPRKRCLDRFPGSIPVPGAGLQAQQASTPPAYGVGKMDTRWTWAGAQLGPYDRDRTDQAKIIDHAAVPCRICEAVFQRLRLTMRSCDSCGMGFCEGEHGNSAGGAHGVCVRCNEHPTERNPVDATPTPSG
jgi:hypothetical protein